MASQADPATVWKLAEEAVVAGDVVTLERLLRDHGQQLLNERPRSAWLGGLAPDYSAPDARAIIARNHHFETWEEFAAFDPRSAFETAADAVVTGNEATLARLLRADPELIRARSARKHRATLLHYVGANGVESFRQRTPKNAVRIAEILLDAGADINAVADMYGGSQPLGLVATSIHPAQAGVQEALIALLLARGAREPISDLIGSALANGRGKAAEFLAARADELDFEAAAGVGRLGLVRQLFDSATEKQ